MKILEVCPFSSGGCGVWKRAMQEAIELKKKGHEVVIYSSNFDKDTNEIRSKFDFIKDEDGNDFIPIVRFPAKKLGGESFMNWNFTKEALDFCPDIIISHCYRHLHTHKSLKIKKILGKKGKVCKVFLVSHGSFNDELRSKFSIRIVKFYDKFIGPKKLKKFDKILPISNWEIPYLIECGAQINNIVRLPNGIPSIFFDKEKTAREENKILFLGRLSPKKRLEILIEAMSFIKDRETILEIVGPKEPEYYEKLKLLVEKLDLQNKVRFLDPIYDLDKKINKIDSCKVFVLPSKVEGMSQSAIESLSRGKIVIIADSISARDLMKEKISGYLFRFDDPKDLALKINEAFCEKDVEKIKETAKKSVEEFNWNIVIEKLLKIIIEEK